ncbi:MAG: TIGR03943 family protein [Mycobacteriaceae bacterium]|nr:TIGR03943 family protein [Mycobacteriaceae bacterium]MBV9641063.1 TIGR03943 family protein [Mycobacteriaceae bacterium]
MNREAENAALLLVGLSIGMIAVTGAFTRYVKPSLLGWLLCAAVALIAFGLATIIGDARERPTDHGHDHRHRARIGWLLAVPIVVLIFVVPPALGAGAATPTVMAVSTDVLHRPFPPLPAERSPVVSLPNVLERVANDTAGTLDHRLITVTGFVLQDHGSTYLARVVIICCAADAQLARIRLSGPPLAQASALRNDSWLSAEGVVLPASPPTMEVSELTRIQPPANTYAYYNS